MWNKSHGIFETLYTVMTEAKQAFKMQKRKENKKRAEAPLRFYPSSK